MHTFPCFRGCFIVNHIILLCKFVCHAERHLLLTIVYITLVPRHGKHEFIPVVIAVFLHFSDPVINRFEGAFGAHVKADECGVSISVVHAQHRPKLFLATRVPNMQLYLTHFRTPIRKGRLARVRHAHQLLKVGPSDGILVNILEIPVVESARK